MEHAPKTKRIELKIPAESTLVRALSRTLIHQGFVVRSEASNMGQSIDLVATKDGDVTAIEVKRMDWRRALEQCKAHMAVADFIVIAIALRAINPELSNIIHEKGWGLMVYHSHNGEWELIIKPERNEPWKPQRDVFMAGLMEIKSNE